MKRASSYPPIGTATATNVIAAMTTGWLTIGCFSWRSETETISGASRTRLGRP